MEKTLAIIKPDAVKKKAAGKIIQRIEEEGFTITGLKMVSLTKEEAEGFYIMRNLYCLYYKLASDLKTHLINYSS